MAYYPRQRGLAFLQTLTPVIFLVLFIGSASASTDFGHCCMRSARSQLSTLKSLPWDACGINKTSTSTPNPLVNATLSWCNQYCPGFQLSTFGQWSDLLTTFIVPALAQLLLCPVGSGNGEEDEKEHRERKNEKQEEGEDKSSVGQSPVPAPSTQKDKPGKTKQHGLQAIFYLIKEYTIVLGDPASAIAACFYQVWKDCEFVWRMCHKNPPGTEDGLYYEHVMGLAIIASQTMLHPTDEDRHSRVFSLSPTNEMVNLVKTTITRTPGKKEASSTQDLKKSPPSSDDGVNHSSVELSKTGLTQVNDLENLPSSNGSLPLEEIQKLYKGTRLRHQVENMMVTLLKAKTDFVNGIVIPVVLTFAGTAAGFYGAYNVLGDRDKGYSLAFGVFFAWLLVLSVVSNCYATTVNPDLLEGYLNALIRSCAHPDPKGSGPSFNFRLRVIPFRKRITGFVRWDHWIKAMTNSPPLPSNDSGCYSVSFLAKFLTIQTVAWLCLSVFTGCATLIAWNTPTIGLGCRAFTFLLYTILSLVLAWLLVLRACLVGRKSLPARLLSQAMPTIYGFVAFVNAFVLVGGTTFHLVGLYRSCKCQLLFSTGDSLVLLSAGTQLDIERARTYWISVGYVAFTFAWIVCAVAIGLREYIYAHLKTRFL
ncbi:hypothetical protein K469DRAFT_710073 [Zopfia rhizophila CBS 207.26]|uniref:Uncharacterized protein n=1 Tax=Zopfia rhizophila CBS 207.26 TaxID=1314779 RepID=A0A6A6E206_9PEZI|nr:hypothetical protein K469DRAFT_710073 [Zopfia rhizophila CBS 207.26]